MTFKVEASRVIAATPERIYGILADYKHGHPGILPPAFTRLEVEEGGYGTGTVFSMTMKAFGKEHDSRVRVTEPEPGRVLQETTEDGKVTTLFYVTPVGSDKTEVRFVTNIRADRGGVLGWLEKKLTVPFLAKVYAEELERLQKAATIP